MFKTRSTLALFGAATVMAVLVAFGGCTSSGTTAPPNVGTNNPPPGPGSAALVVTDPFAVFEVFLPTDNGTVAPHATIMGGNTTLHEIKAVARDSNGNFYVGDNQSSSGPCPRTRLDRGQVVIFDRTANGDAFPAAVIAGPTTTLDDSINGIAVDSSKNIYVSQDNSSTETCIVPTIPPTTAPTSQGFHTARIMVFSGVGASGDIAPSAQIFGSNTHLVEPNQLTFDSSGKLWTADTDAPDVKAYNVTGLSGDNNLTPAIRITSASFCTTGANGNGPVGVAVDSSNNVYVADNCAGQIFRFNAITSNCLACVPDKTITPSGASSNFSHIVTDGTHLFVSIEVSSPIIEVYLVGDDGVTVPTAKIYDLTGNMSEGKGLSL